jgi:hypothetical protein
MFLKKSSSLFHEVFFQLRHLLEKKRHKTIKDLRSFYLTFFGNIYLIFFYIAISFICGFINFNLKKKTNLFDFLFHCNLRTKKNYIYLCSNIQFKSLFYVFYIF